MSAARYSIGIDLGTTHCALSYVDLHASEGENTVYGVLDIPQLTGPGTVEGGALLPSFLYLPHESELAEGDLNLPWSSTQSFAVGEFARARGALTPIRLVSSAKSWLCHPGVDRRAAILPPDSPPEVARVSPLGLDPLPGPLAPSLGPRPPRRRVGAARRHRHHSRLVRPRCT